VNAIIIGEIARLQTSETAPVSKCRLRLLSTRTQDNQTHLKQGKNLLISNGKNDTPHSRWKEKNETTTRRPDGLWPPVKNGSSQSAVKLPLLKGDHECQGRAEAM